VVRAGSGYVEEVTGLVKPVYRTGFRGERTFKVRKLTKAPFVAPAEFPGVPSAVLVHTVQMAHDINHVVYHCLYETPEVSRP
jgi:hypothetical protein